MFRTNLWKFRRIVAENFSKILKKSQKIAVLYLSQVAEAAGDPEEAAERSPALADVEDQEALRGSLGWIGECFEELIIQQKFA